MPPMLLARAAAAKRASLHVLQQAGLITGPNQDKFVNRLMFTITDATGRVIAFGGRTLNGIGAKYVNSPTTPLFDKSNTLYGLEQARHEIVRTGTAVIVEGYTDVIMAHQVGCTNVVATLGTSFTAGHGRTLRRYAKRVVLLFDSDTAGMAAANRALEVCLSQHLDIKLAFVPQGKDPCDFAILAGKEGLDRVIEQAVDVLQFKWDKLNGDVRLRRHAGQPQGGAGRVSSGDRHRDGVGDAARDGERRVRPQGREDHRAEPQRPLWRVGAAKTAGGRRPPRAEARRADAPQAVDWGQGLYAAAQKEILEVLLNEPGLFHAVEQDITEDLFDVPILSRIASISVRGDPVRGGFHDQSGACPARSRRSWPRASSSCSRSAKARGTIIPAWSMPWGFCTGTSIVRHGDVRTHKAGPRVDSTEIARGRPGRQNPHSIGLT